MGGSEVLGLKAERGSEMGFTYPRGNEKSGLRSNRSHKSRTNHWPSGELLV